MAKLLRVVKQSGAATRSREVTEKVMQPGALSAMARVKVSRARAE
jgi:hypothetical protein